MGVIYIVCKPKSELSQVTIRDLLVSPVMLTLLYSEKNTAFSSIPIEKKSVFFIVNLINKFARVFFTQAVTSNQLC